MHTTRSSFFFGLRLVLFFVIAVAATAWIVTHAFAQEVHFNQRPGERLDVHVIEGMEKAAQLAAADRSKPVTVDVLIFQFTHKEIADKILEITSQNPNLQVRLVGDWTSMNAQDNYTARNIPEWDYADGRKRKQNKYRSPSQNRPPYLTHVANGKYRDACQIVVQVSGRVPTFTVVEPVEPTDPGPNASAADQQAYQEAMVTYALVLERYESDKAVKEEYVQKMDECIADLEQRFNSQPINNLSIRFKIDEPYVWSASRRMVTYSHAASKGLNHHKGFVVRAAGQPQHLVSGSYNWSATAENSNYENLMVFDRDDTPHRDLLYDYAAEFDGFYFDTEVTLTLDEAKEFGGWLRKKVKFDAVGGTNPGPRPVRSNPAGGSGGGSISSGCNPSVNPNCTLASDVLAAAGALEPVNINNSSTTALASKLGIPSSTARSIYRNRLANGPFTDMADFTSRTGAQLPEDRAEFGPQQVFVNEASAEELQGIPGIGPSLAAKIVAHREMFGEFDTVDDLTDVSGIGSATLARMKPFVDMRYSEVYFSSRRLGEDADIGYAPSNAEKTILVRTSPDSPEVERVKGVLTQPVIDLMRRTQPGQTVRVAAYGFSQRTQEFEETVEAARRGAKVQVILHKGYTEATVQAFKDLVQAESLDIEVRIPRKTMHEKFGFNGDDVFNGSANLSGSSSTKHSEDRFMFKNDQQLVDRFADRFKQIWEDSEVKVAPITGAG